MVISYFKKVILLLFVVLFTASCVVQRSPVSGSKRAYGYSWEKEIKIGKQADKQIQQQYGVYDDENVLEYVKGVGHSVLEVSHMRRDDTPQKYRETEFHFRVLNSPVVNAFALPGGYVYVTRGLLAHLENEAQLAVVLGHEIGHVAARHASQRALEQQIGQIALIGGAVAGEELLGVPGGSVLQLGSQAAQFLFLSYGRDDERESDRLGVEYAAMKNYEAAEGAGFFGALQRISKQSGQDIPDWQSTHPDPSERANTIPELAEKWKEKGYDQTIEDTDEYMGMVDGMIYGNNPREGFAEEGTFYHPELAFKFSYPESWKIVNRPTLVAAVNEDQDAVSVMEIDGEAETPKSSVINYVSQEGFTVVSQEATQNNGLSAYKANATAMTKDSTQYRFHVYAVSYDDNIYRFTSYSLADKFAAYQPQFVDISSSFAELNDPDILNIKPVRLQAVRADRTGDFRSFLPQDLPMDIEPEDIAIINQVEMNETIENGDWIKIPRQ
ncbi:M48 family metalloprotease [Fodinibius halophilus]|uniref:M48 family metalloprotease n=1 Tax=Fodinibius halophilus TaxID=1736908 RepID=A0A6M1STD0_9BACT|nr:M48 family metalloprotease [Fodinibius halophilus]NGP86806.1 M48 family metalloprotease [Fodinibius halophilus]